MHSLINPSIFSHVFLASSSEYFTGSLAPQTGLGQHTSFSNLPKTWQWSCLHTHPIIPVFNLVMFGHPFTSAFEQMLISRINRV